MVFSTALKCSTILARIRVVFVTRGALLVAEDGGRDNTPTSPFAPNFSKTFLRSRYEMYGGSQVPCENCDFFFILATFLATFISGL